MVSFALPTQQKSSQSLLVKCVIYACKYCGRNANLFLENIQKSRVKNGNLLFSS